MVPGVGVLNPGKLQGCRCGICKHAHRTRFPLNSSSYETATILDLWIVASPIKYIVMQVYLAIANYSYLVVKPVCIEDKVIGYNTYSVSACVQCYLG